VFRKGRAGGVSPLLVRKKQGAYAPRSPFSEHPLIATAPAHPAGVVDVRVVTAGGTSATSSADHFTYYATPTVTGLSPSTGPDSGGTTVTITGANFTGATDVHFAGMPATSFTVVSATTITTVSPLYTPGTVPVTVTTPGGTSDTGSASQFTYTSP